MLTFKFIRVDSLFIMHGQEAFGPESSLQIELHKLNFFAASFYTKTKLGMSHYHQAILRIVFIFGGLPHLTIGFTNHGK